MLKRFAKVYFYLIFLAIYLFYSPQLSYSYFNEGFNGMLDNENDWEINNGSGISFSNTTINFNSSTSRIFPYLRSKVPLISSSDELIKVKFKYNGAGTNFGDGFAITDQNPPLGTVMNYPSAFAQYTMFYVWHTPNTPYFHIVTFLCNSGELSCPNNIPKLIYQSDNVDLNEHLLEVRVRDSVYTLMLDGVHIFTSSESSRLASNLWFGHPETTNTDGGWASFSIDYIEVGEPPSSFPYLSQNDSLWASKEYDSAGSWAGVDKSGIDRWGCALTSVAMILQNYNVKTLSGEVVDPDNLNAWLKSQPDGYIGPGLLNWLAVTRFAKNSFDADKAPKKLEYVRSYLPTTPILPAIFSTGSHFVVAHGEDTTSWQINDPANVDTKNLAKTTNIKSVNRFVESETDLSYMMFVINPDDIATLKDANDNTVEITWIDEYLSDDVDTSTSSALRIGMLAKPATGRYLFTINKQGSGSSEAKIYLYDEIASPSAQVINLDKPVTNLQIDYVKDNSTSDVVTEIDLTPPPTPIIISPFDGAYQKPSGLILDWSEVTDPSMPVTYNYKSYWDGGSYGPVSTGTNSQIDASGTTDGQYMWQVQACDTALNCSEWTTASKLVVDNISPTSDIIFPTPGPGSNYFEVVYSELIDPLEATDGANYYLSNWPGAGGSGDLVGDSSISYNPLNRTARIIFTNPDWYISPEQLWGVQNIHDLAGNLLAVAPYTEYSTPMTPPIVSVPVVTPNPNNSLTQNWSWLHGSDIGSGIKGYSSKTYDLVAQQYLSDWLWIGQVLGTSTTLGEGKWQLALQATDFAGNISETKTSETLTVDVTSPSVPANLHFVNPNISCGGFTNSKTITFDWDDATDNNKVAGYEYSIDYPVSGGRGLWTTFFTTSSYRGSLNEGIHYLKLLTKDTAGNYSRWSNSCAITYDSITPKLSSKTTFSGWYNRIQTSEFIFEDTNLDTSYVKPSCEITTEGLNQSCQVIPNVCDKAGNCYTNILTSSLVNTDFSKPAVSLNAWGSTIDGTATDTLSGVEKVEIRIRKPDQNEVTVSATGTTNWTYTMTDPSMGNYKIVVLAYDKAGNLNDEVSKEFVMSPASQDLNRSSNNSNNSSVLGAATTTTKSIKRFASPTPILETVADEIQQDKNVEEPSKAGEVLGDVDTQRSTSKIYLWVFAGCILGLLALLWFTFRAKRK